MAQGSRVPAEWDGDSWFMGRQSAYTEHAASDAFPPFLRVTFAAYGRMAANGHATFDQRELAELLGCNVRGGWQPADRRSVRKAIDRAVEKGLLGDGSKALCLVVPRSMVAFGKGNAAAGCKRHPQASESQRLRAVR